MGQTNHNQISAVLVVMGVSGCGKSSVARALAGHLNLAFLEADDLHPAENIKKMSCGIALTDEDRAPWLGAVRQKAQGLVESDRGCVIACSALKKAYRDQLRRTHPATFFVYLEGSRELILQRMQQRSDHFMPPQLLDSQFETLENPGAEPRVVTVAIEDSIDGISDSAIMQLRALADFS